jgi:hypothetical protein
MTKFATDLLEMMAGWNTIMEAARKEFPTATDEEIQQIAAGAMKYALGIK